jgi:nucleoside-diphosphate-sugar epimerase
MTPWAAFRALAPAELARRMAGRVIVDPLRVLDGAAAAAAGFDHHALGRAPVQAAVPPAHLLYVSSDAIYADDANPVTERSAAAPSTLHGMMHAARELMLKSAAPAPFAALRPTLIYGSADPHSGYGPNRFRRQALKGEPISIFGEGEERRDHVLVDDVAALAVLMLRHRSVGALNAVTGVSVCFHDVAELVAAQFSPPARVVSVPRPGPRPHLLHRHFDITNCLKAFPGFRYTSLADGIARVHREAMETKA